jgi:hypothetical protein
MTLSKKGLFGTFSITTLSIMTVNITIFCHYAERHYAECRVLFIVMPNVIILSVVVLNVVAPALASLENIGPVWRGLPGDWRSGLSVLSVCDDVENVLKLWLLEDEEADLDEDSFGGQHRPLSDDLLSKQATSAHLLHSSSKHSFSPMHVLSWNNQEKALRRSF